MTDTESLRLLIPDSDTTSPIFSDGDLTLFMTLSDQKLFLAAAMALETIATDEALVYKITTTDDMNVNGVTGAVQVLLARAKTLRADQDRLDNNAQPGFFLTFPENPFYCYPEAAARWLS
ncbi:MAG: hypothetical protein WC322_04670 [Candidatus Paceibacterota bacterium]|jgi:hypothetical protein